MSAERFRPRGTLNPEQPTAAVAWLCDGLACIAILLLTLRRWSQLGPYPPGLDGAQWLALGRGLRGIGRSSQGAFAPLLPLLANVTDAVVGPLPTVRLLATMSALAVSIAVWLVARAVLGPMWGFIAAALVVPSSALAEPVFYGGFSQQLALAGGIVALGGACLFLTTGATALLGVVSISALLAASAHHLYFPLLLLSLLAAMLIWLSVAENRSRWRRLGPLTLSLLPAVVVSCLVAYQFILAGYAAPLSATTNAPVAAWHYATREAPLVWLLLALLAVATLAATWRKRGEAAWLLSFALMIPWAALLIATGQPRLAPPLLVGIAAAVAIGARAVALRSVPTSGLLLAASLIALLLGVLADRAATDFADYYRVVDPPLLGATAAIASQSEPGAIAVRQDHRGWPIGWWFEALQTKPVYTGSDPRWLGFPDERTRASQTTALFDGRLDAIKFKAQASALGVRYLVIPKWDWIGWDRWLHDPLFPVDVLYDDDHYLVLLITG